MGVMPSKTATARMTGKTAIAMIRHPMLRRATAKAAKPPAKVGWRVGKIVVKRKARGQTEKARGHVSKARGQMSRARGQTREAQSKMSRARDQMGKARGQVGDQMGRARDQMVRAGAAGKTLGSLMVVYGPMAAEVFGVIEKPKPKRRAPAFAAGVATGAGALYALNRKKSD